MNKTDKIYGWLLGIGLVIGVVFMITGWNKTPEPLLIKDNTWDMNEPNWIESDPNYVYLTWVSNYGDITIYNLEADYNDFYDLTFTYNSKEVTFSGDKLKEGKIICDSTYDEFMDILPYSLSIMMTRTILEPNKPIEIIWAEPNESNRRTAGAEGINNTIIDEPNLPYGIIAWGYKAAYCLTSGQYCIALGYKAGYDWTTQKRMFAFSIPNTDGTYTEYSTQMTKDEYLNVYHVVNRALKNKRILEP